MFIVGHTLVWHKQTPRWVVQDSSGQPVSRDTLRQRLRDHIQTVVGRFRGDRKSTRLNSSHSQISYAVFCLKKKNTSTHSEPHLQRRANIVRCTSSATDSL